MGSVRGSKSARFSSVTQDRVKSGVFRKGQGSHRVFRKSNKMVRWSQASVRVSPGAGRAPCACERGGSAAPCPANPSAPAVPPGPAPDGIPAGSAPGTRRARPAPAPPPGTIAPRSRTAATTAMGRPGPGTALGGDGSGLRGFQGDGRTHRLSGGAGAMGVDPQV